MRLHRLTLTFIGDHQHLESGFREDYYRTSINLFRLNLLIGVVFYGIFGVLDALLFPQSKTVLWLIRYAIICPALLGAILWSFTRSFKKYWQMAITFCMIMAGSGIIGMMIVAPPPVNYAYSAGLILVLFFGYTLSRALFVWATFSGWILIVLYETAAVFLIDTPLPILINNTFFLLAPILLV